MKRLFIGELLVLLLLAIVITQPALWPEAREHILNLAQAFASAVRSVLDALRR